MKISPKHTQTKPPKTTNASGAKRNKRSRKPKGIDYGRAHFDSKKSLRDYHESVADAFFDANPFGAT